MLAYCFGKTSDSTESLNADIEGDPKYQNNKLGRIQEGLAFFVSGNILRHGDRFIIDFGLDNANKDIALRIACRVSSNSLGRNSRIKHIWGVEETNSAIPFRLNSCSTFEIQVLFTVDHILIALNGLHIAKFAHRLPFHDIRNIDIRGDITDVHVERNIVTDYPTRPDKTPHIVRLGGRYANTSNLEDLESEADCCELATTDAAERFLPLPYYATFDKGFFDLGYSIGVRGHVRLNPHTFKVALQVGQNVWPQPTIALLLEFRFTRQRDGETGEPVIARNSFANGKWTGEIKSELATGLRPGADFHLVVVRGRKSFEIYMNDKPVTDYPYKVNPKYVDTCFIAGDIKLFSVDIESD
ncbi:LOW QUALITY PROTEIN: galectin-4-like [Lucilia sericata]|uniref:LOW QUALITY PROTEIN: galectin-4-like n=1 Tax=Lucilia sericata TaxID=13632 RepID=UPI0018A81699|nr:LOW QUALITY PROTEIN: galectin-4-like [Lucilia sericata]